MNREVTIFGVGCTLCRLLHKNTLAAAMELGIDLEVREVTDIQKMIKRGIAAIPALAIGDEVVASGQVPDVADIKGLLLERARA